MILQHVNNGVPVARRNGIKESKITREHVRCGNKLLILLFKQAFENEGTDIEFVAQIAPGILFDSVINRKKCRRLHNHKQTNKKYNDALFEAPELSKFHFPILASVLMGSLASG